VADYPSPIGVVLAGGRGTRMGGSKPVVQLGGRPLLDYPLGALKAVLGEVAVIAKPDTELPPLPGVTVWIEPAEPRHPLLGIVEALAMAGGRPVVVCAADLPLVSPALITRLLSADLGGAPAAIATCRGQAQPLLGHYLPAAAALLAPAARQGEQPVRRAVEAIDPLHIEVEDPDELFNVNSPEDLLIAQSLLDRQSPR
jgi:molybdopterin-guanine dinucleotide biosynthesis protein A